MLIVSTGTLHAAGIGIGLIHKWDWGRSALRAAGVVIALAGVWFVWSAVGA